MARASTQQARPLPALEGHAKEFYAWCKRGELRFQRCGGCGAWRHVPRELCGECGSWEWGWTRSSGRGKVFTWTVVARAMHPGFAGAEPFAPAVIEMEEGVRLVAEVVDCPPDQLQVGMPVEVTFHHVTPDVTLPKFRRRRAETQPAPRRSEPKP